MTKLLIADDKDSDMRYASGLRISDPFIWIQTGEGKNARNYVLVSSLELSRAKAEAKRGTIVVHWDKVDMARIKRKPAKRGLADIAAAFLISKGVKEVAVPESMRAGHYETLKGHGLRVRFASPFMPQRAIKTAAEVAAIRRTGAVTEQAFLHCISILRKAKIGPGGALMRNGKRLTSEMLKSEMDRIFLENGCIGQDTIIACGRHASQPHNTGSGPLYAHQPIVFDIFPRDMHSGYYFDMSRTVVKGKPSAELQRLYDAVLASQQAGLAAAKPGAKAKDVHAACAQVFERLGYKTSAEEGFIHSTGHGVGLDIHERPAVSGRSDEILAQGMVITVEPGLYYKRLGGVRIEDTVLVTGKGMMNLTKAPKVLVIR